MEQRKLDRIFQKGRCKWRRRAFHPFETSRFLLSNRRCAGLERRETLYQVDHHVFCQCENKKAASRRKRFLANWFIFRTKSARPGATERHLERYAASVFRGWRGI